jgi:hypothetical protein
MMLPLFLPATLSCAMLITMMAVAVAAAAAATAAAVAVASTTSCRIDAQAMADSVVWASLPVPSRLKLALQKLHRRLRRG